MGIEVIVEGPAEFRRPAKHNCDTPGGWSHGPHQHRVCTFAPGSVWRCGECSRRWVSVKMHLLNGEWEAAWRPRRWYRRGADSFPQWSGIAGGAGDQ